MSISATSFVKELKSLCEKHKIQVDFLQEKNGEFVAIIGNHKSPTTFSHLQNLFNELRTR